VLRELFSPGVDDAPVTDELLGACVRVLKDWDWAQRPAAVVSMPSRSRPQLVDSLARGIARIGRLEDLGALVLVGEGSRGGPGGNSAYRLADVWGTFGVHDELAASLSALGGQPVLLIDDRVDSRWSMTVAARELRRHGAGSVLPLALAVVA
jgi:ATP-dependent DNA helicase RecQ